MQKNTRRFVWVTLLVLVIIGGVWSASNILGGKFNKVETVLWLLVGAGFIWLFVQAWDRFDLTGAQEVAKAAAEATTTTPLREIDDPLWKERVRQDAQRSTAGKV